MSATALVGLDGFVVTSVLMHDGEHRLLVETAESRSVCRSCGVFGVGNGRRFVWVRDLPIAVVATVIVWAKRSDDRSAAAFTPDIDASTPTPNIVLLPPQSNGPDEHHADES